MPAQSCAYTLQSAPMFVAAARAPCCFAKYSPVCAPDIRECAALQDVAGCDEAKTEVMEFVNFLKVS